MTDIQIFLHDRVNVAEQPLAGKKYVTVKEFSGWLVRETTQQEQGLFILWGNTYLPLDWSGEFQGYLWPKGRGKYIEKRSSVAEILRDY